MSTVLGIEKNSYDYAQAYAATQSSNTTVVNELVQAYNLIAANQGISVYQFLQTLAQQGSSYQQAVYLTAQLNNVRVRSALLGVPPASSTPAFIAREISA